MLYLPPFMQLPPREMRIRIALFLFLFLAVAVPARGDESGGHPCMPFGGESMLFAAGWEFILAGTADMRVEVHGNGYRIISHGRSNRFLDLFHKVRDRTISEGVCRGDRLQSTLFDVVQNEGHYHSRKKVRFFWRRGISTFSQNGKTDTYEVPAGYLNAIDAFFAVRKMHLAPGTTVHVPLFDSRKRYLLEVAVLKRVRMMAPWGRSVVCLLVEPRLKTKGIFSSKGKVRLWLTDDDRHIPLKMVAKVKIGHVVSILGPDTPGNYS